MLCMFASFWQSVLQPTLKRPERLQMAALCHRGEGAQKEFLLITSRGSGRWIIPKGWPIRGLTGAETALREAWEEAGVKHSVVNTNPIGNYTYQKKGENSFEVSVKTLVYSITVKDLVDEFPEAKERKRKWVSAEIAAKLVGEAVLKSIFLEQKT